MELPALAIKQPNIAGIYQAVNAIDESRDRKKLVDLKVREAERAGQAVSARLALLGGGAKLSPDDVQGQGGASGGIDLKSPEFQTYMAFDPKGAQQIVETVSKMGAEERAAAKEKNSAVGNTLAGIMTAPALQRPALWEQAKQMASQIGIDPKTLPEQWNDNWGQLMLARAGMTDDLLKMQNTGVPSGYERVEGGLRPIVGGPADPRQAAALDRTLVETYDPKSPSGTILTPRGDAAGKPGKPSAGLKLVADGNGGFTLEQGPGVTGALQKPTYNKVEEKILNSGDTLSQLTTIKNTFKPEYQQIGTRWSAMMSSLKDKAGVDLDKAERTLLEDYTKYRASAGQLFALTLKDLSGVAVNPTEFKRAEAWLPNPGSGLTDGDSPAQLKAKVERFEDFTRKALAKANYIRKNGMSVNDIDVDKMPDIMNKRGDALMKELSATGLSGDALKTAVKQKLSDEFGIGAM